MSPRIFIHANNVHQGGGRTLLFALLEAISVKYVWFATLDARLQPLMKLFGAGCVKWVGHSVLHRLNSEWWLARAVAAEDVVLCFGNLPPLFKLRGHAVVFVQNRYLVDDVGLNRFPFRVRMRLAMERMWLSSKLTNASEFVVQTPMMKRLLEIKTRGRVPVRVLPFVSEPKDYSRGLLQSKAQNENDFDFVYVASGEPHKNHLRLIEAWCLLAEEGLFPSLCLTLGDLRFAGLCREIEVMRQRYGLKVQNDGELSHHQVLAIYKKSGAAIYPSVLESFGLPLIEARQAGLPVLASELDYVRDVLDPEQTFDPESAASIARAVKRFMGLQEEPLPLHNAARFIEHLLEGVK